MGKSEKDVLDCELKNRKKFRGYWLFLNFNIKSAISLNAPSPPLEVQT
jgi:hypothetical protein